CPPVPLVVVHFAEGEEMKRLYARLMLWIIRPALSLHVRASAESAAPSANDAEAFKRLGL
ncbi:hypothetical protein N6G05_27045, partial [Cupriavidus gilardii]|uniref:hypothetical protein n=1 Tax=Cupriavidus gilardii TaxID=82541 RepID=UPI0021C00C31